MHLLLDSPQMWVLLIGSIVPLGGYLLNRFAPWTTEPVKGLIQVVLAGVAGALYTALETDILGWNAGTVELVLTAIVAALFAHNLLWKPAKVNTKLGAIETDVVRE